MKIETEKYQRELEREKEKKKLQDQGKKIFKNTFIFENCYIMMQNINFLNFL